ncbi:hypothetical protein B0T19DRAFT_57545 [Cercophora scortea]|uniref:Uncharacterized protein n=1 Tax=Cercophora scortea TaxID=314031 RepID=A0AAE0J5M0_9PEZI|nr:hypothetical protein B0T19DRAFT_57545 [Cercophora scortea]
MIHQDDASLASTGESEKPCTRSVESTKRRDTANHNITLECPYQGCKGQGQRKPFRRHQELVRHYTIHLACKEFCQYCSSTFTQARKFITHKCATNGSDDQKRFVKARIEELRSNAKRELGLKAKRIGDVALLDPSQPKRHKSTRFGDSHGNMERSASFRVQAAQPDTQSETTNDTTSQSRDISFTEGVGSNQPASGCSNGLFSPRSQFLSADSDWQSQTTGFSVPLWPTQPSAQLPDPSWPTQPVDTAQLPVPLWPTQPSARFPDPSWPTQPVDAA